MQGHRLGVILAATAVGVAERDEAVRCGSIRPQVRDGDGAPVRLQIARQFAQLREDTQEPPHHGAEVAARPLGHRLRRLYVSWTLDRSGEVEFDVPPPLGRAELVDVRDLELIEDVQECLGRTAVVAVEEEPRPSDELQVRASAEAASCEATREAMSHIFFREHEGGDEAQEVRVIMERDGNFHTPAAPSSSSCVGAVVATVPHDRRHHAVRTHERGLERAKRGLHILPNPVTRQDDVLPGHVVDGNERREGRTKAH